DLEEAVRLGHQIGVMKDGKMLQIGSADDIIGNPKDPYVEKFVQGSSRLGLLKAESVMVPLSEFAATSENLHLTDAPRVKLDAPIKEILGLANNHPNGPLVVVDAQGSDVGIVTPSLILRGIHERI
ncbi:glycine/betaine ABC transporter, partial [Mesorhizobium sp. Cs1299R1N1]